MTIHPRPIAELKQIAQDIRSKRIFTTFHLPDQDLSLFSMTFASFAFMRQSELHDLVRKAGLIFEYIDRALPGINGHPLFLTAQLLTKEDADVVLSLIRQPEEAQS